MTREEFDKKLSVLNDDYHKKVSELKTDLNIAKQRLGLSYAQSNNPYNVGDVIKDHAHIMRIERIGYTWVLGGDIMECIYSGTLLNEKLVPLKKQNTDIRIYQSNVKCKIQ